MKDHYQRFLERKAIRAEAKKAEQSANKGTPAPAKSAGPSKGKRK